MLRPVTDAMHATASIMLGRMLTNKKIKGILGKISSSTPLVVVSIMAPNAALETTDSITATKAKINFQLSSPPR